MKPFERAPSVLVDDPEITEVMDEETGTPIAAWDAVGNDWDKAVGLRNELAAALAREDGRMLCSTCAVPVYLVAMPDRRRFYFKHTHEDGNCPALTRGLLSREQIDALRYHGQRESRRHKRLKELVAQSLNADPRFADVVVEGTWRGKDQTRRRPDVRAVLDGRLPVAFEIQLSTTYIGVMAERRHFYLSEGGLLVWILPEFDETTARMTAFDAFISNNHNVFVAGEHTLAASLERQALMLDVHWHEPRLDDGSVCRDRRHALTPFADLSIDRERQRVYRFDWESELAKVEAQATEEAARAEAARIEATTAPLRNAFEAFWLQHDDTTTVHWQAPWGNLRRGFQAHGIELPGHPFKACTFRDLVRACYSAKVGKPVGFDHENLVAMGHHLFVGRKACLWAFSCALRAFGRAGHFREHDRSGRWAGKKGKAEKYREAWAKEDPAFAPERRWDRLLAWLFPEIREVLPTGPKGRDIWAGGFDD